MFGSTVLEIGIGLIFVYLTISLAVTAAQELIAGALRLRAENLRRGIVSLLGDSTLAAEFLSHPMIRGMTGADAGTILAGGTPPADPVTATRASLEKAAMPSYIAARTFAMVLLDLACSGRNTPYATCDDIRSSIPADWLSKPIGTNLRVLLNEAGNDLEKLQENIEIWYNNNMDRVSGWYKRRSQAIAAVISLVLVVASNADSIAIATALSEDPDLRAALVARAERMADSVAASRPKAQPIGNPLPSREPGAERRGSPQPNTDVRIIPVQDLDTAQSPDTLPAPPGDRDADTTPPADRDADTTPPGDRDTDTTATIPPPTSDTGTAEVDTAGARDMTLDSLAELATRLRTRVTALQEPGLPLGWKGRPHGFWNWVTKIFGLLITACAVSLGAPFWFDILNKIIQIRSAGKSPTDASKPPEAKAKRKEEQPPK